jgi:DNA polymerase I-like protein with 3'-5' exonuclease and polymerase domains
MSQIYLVTEQSQLFDNNNYKIIGVEESLELLSPLTVVGLDTETEGLDPYTKNLLSVQLGCNDFQIVIDCSTINIQQYKEYLESDRLFIGWNLKFDLKFLFHKRIVPKRVYDGFLAEKLMWLGYPAGFHSMSLKTAGETYCNIELDKSVRGLIIWKGLISEVIEYAALDVKYLEEIMNKQLIELNKKGLNVAIDYENRFVLPLSYMEYCGVKLDVEKWKVKMLHDKEREELAKNACNKWFISNITQDKFKELYNKYIFVNLQGDLFEGFNTEPQVKLNWNSAKQVAEIFKAFGVDVVIEDKTTGKGKDSIDAKQLKPQKDKCSLIPLYLEYKEAVKVTSTYGENFLKQINCKGRICTNYSQLGADTTRITSGGKDKTSHTDYLNLLNLPGNPETRECFCAENGNKWISIDYSGQETYLMASIADDKAIINELTEGSGDIHSLTAYIAYPEIPRDTKIKDIKKLYHNYRQEAKGIEFAINYGGTADTISRNKGIPIEEATTIYNNYMKGFTGLKKYQDFRRKDWLNKGYILLSHLTGHKAYIYDFDELKTIQSKFNNEGFWSYYREMKASCPDCETVQNVRKFFKRKSASEKQSINYPIQAAGSMCLRVSMINFFEYLRKNNLLFKVLICVAPYDEINCEAPAEIAEDIAKVLYNCMVKAGSYFCTKCKLDAEVSRAKDGTLPTFWIH